MRAHLLAVAIVSFVACSRGASDDGKLLGKGDAQRVPPPFDWGRPAAALELDPDQVARRLGSFEWSGAVEWTVARAGEEARRVRAVEHHRVRQAASGEFEVSAEIDPGLGPGSETGKDLVYAGGTTYARARYAPFRERPTDRGRDARRFRDESFFAARSIARLLGPGLVLRPAGEGQMVHRRARKFSVALAEHAAGAPPGAPLPAAADADTRQRRAFLEGLRPRSASGELVLDADTGVPLLVRLSADFGVQGDSTAAASVELLAQVTAAGSGMAAVAPPKGALPDDRKTAGVTRALEAAGFKKQPDEAEGKKESAEPAEDAPEE